MNTNVWNEPSDEEIERDVVELRQLLERVDSPSEPHPAYWQNFLVHVRGRIDEKRFRHKRVVPMTAWASLSAAALVVVMIVGGVFNQSGVQPRDVASSSTTDPERASDKSEVLYDVKSNPSTDQPTSNSDALYGEQTTHSLILSTTDVQMLNAILTDDNDGIFESILDAEEI